MKRYSDIKPILTESILEAFPQAEGDEVEAAVTHWLQSPSADIPFFSPSMRDHCLSLFEPVCTRENVLQVREPEAVYQGRLPIEWADIPFPPP